MSLELQTCFAGRVSQSGDAAVVEEAAPVEHDAAHAGRLGPLGDEPAHGGGGGLVPGGAGPKIALDGAGRRNGAPGDVVDDLGADVLVGPVHRQARALGGAAHALANAVVAPLASDLLVLRHVCHESAITWPPSQP